MAGTLITDRRTASSHYRILKRLGKGGMAEVFLSEQEGMAGVRRLAVVKKILPQFSEVESVAAMLVDEARIAIQLSHPNIVQIFELGLDEEQYFIAMEFVDGCDLATLARIERHQKSRIPMRLTLRVLSEAAMGLDFAHRKSGLDGRPLNVIHRDVSPHNIMCSRDGGVKVTDFGIAKAVGKQQITEVGVVKGKVQYMAPEQYTGSEIDHRADIYSLGVVLYQLTTGKLPRASQGGKVSMKRVIEGKIPLPSTIRSDYPAELERIAMKALSHEPKDRYPDCASFRDDLLSFARQHDLLAFPKELGDYVNKLVPPSEIKEESIEGDPEIGRKLKNQDDTLSFGTEKVPQGAVIKSDRISDPYDHTQLSKQNEIDDRAFMKDSSLINLKHQDETKPSVPKRIDINHASKPYLDDTGDDDPTYQESDGPSYLRGSLLSHQLDTEVDSSKEDKQKKKKEKKPKKQKSAPNVKSFNPLLWILGLAAIGGLVAAVYFGFRAHENNSRPKVVIQPKIDHQPKIKPKTEIKAGYLDLMAEPAKAKIFIDGAQRCSQTPCRVEGLPLGTILVTAKADGYRIWNQRVVLTEKKPILLLKPILSREDGASASVIKNEEGKTPTKKQRNLHRRKPKAKKAPKPKGKGAPPIEGVTLVKGKAKVIREKSDDKNSLIAISVRPKWAEVWVNGKKIGTTPLARAVDPGTYRIDLRNGQLKYHVYYNLKIKAGEKIKIIDSPRPQGG